MSIDPQAIWSERFSTIGELIAKNADLLVERWSVRSLKEQTSAERVHYEQLRDALPKLLSEMGVALASSGAESGSAHRQIAFEHGEQRWQVGWKLTEVVRDYQILRLVILEFLDTTLNEPLQTRECMAIGLALDEAIGLSVVSYVRNQEQQLRATQERMTEFLALLSHELRDPLAPLHTSLELLRVMGSNDAPLPREALDTAQRSLDHMTRLVEDLLDVSRVASGKLALSKQHVRLDEMIRRALEITTPMFEKRGHRLDVQSTDHDVWLIADPLRIAQVFVNLLSNAARYTPPNGQIRLTVERHQSDVLVRVHDNGIGISPDLLPQIFDFFVQAETGTSRASGGLGIGLALVSRLVELHGGSIAASSPGLNCGSEFAVRLPLAPAGAPTVSATPSSSDVAQTVIAGQRVLVVDDNQDGAQMLAMYLRTCGHEVEVGHNGEDALRLLDSHGPDVIILDIGLPRIDGYAVAQQIRGTERGKLLRLIAVTGYGQEQDRRRALESGFDDHLVKPVSLEELRKLVNARQS
jgi:signal transduction histidine kinase